MLNYYYHSTQARTLRLNNVHNTVAWHVIHVMHSYEHTLLSIIFACINRRGDGPVVSVP